MALKKTPKRKLVEIAGSLKAMTHPMRLRIVEILHPKELTVSAIQKNLGLPQAVTSQHLAALRRFGAVKARRDGNHMYYSLADKRLTKVMALMMAKK